MGDRIMETASIDIFATKGIEYLLILGFLFLLIFFWRFLNRSKEPVNDLNSSPEKVEKS